MIPSIFNVNVNGIPPLSSTGVTVSATDVRFSFNAIPSAGRPFRGFLAIRIANAIPAGTTTTLPIVFTTGGNNPQPLLGYNEAPVTVADLPGTGIYIAWYDQASDYLQLVTGIV